MPAVVHTYLRKSRPRRTPLRPPPSRLFSSDYPHWDFDDPRYALTTLPAEIRQRVKVDNAVETYGARL